MCVKILQIVCGQAGHYQSMNFIKRAMNLVIRQTHHPHHPTIVCIQTIKPLNTVLFPYGPTLDASRVLKENNIIIIFQTGYTLAK